jgi:hypothetical protein
VAGAYDDTVIIEDRCGRNPCSTVESDIKVSRSLGLLGGIFLIILIG